MDASKIPDGMYCYCRGGCPYHKEIPHMKVKFGGYYCSVHMCEYLNVNSMSLELEGYHLDSWYLTDQCKLCGVNMSDNVD